MTSTSNFRRQRRAEGSSYPTEETLLLHDKDQPVNALHADIKCLMWETIGIQQQTVWAKWRVILLQQLSWCVNCTVAVTVIYRGLIELLWF
jgi:hypothetical protein